MIRKNVAFGMGMLCCGLLPAQAPLSSGARASTPTTTPTTAPASTAATTATADYPFQPVPSIAVHLTDDFWAPRIETNRIVTIPFAFAQAEKTGDVDNFVRAAAALHGDTSQAKLPPYPFDDSDLYKILEGASYSLAGHPDAKLDAYVDGLIAKVGAAQEPDGYLYTARTINPAHPHAWAGPQRWLRDSDQSHELYDTGHLFEAAAAHFQATGKRTLLNIAIKEADLLCKTFGPGPGQIGDVWPGHENIEMGLVQLYRVTNDERYLNLAKFFIDIRGKAAPGSSQAHYEDDYHQSRIPPTQQTEALGHAVRAEYLYSGMADIAALTGDASYLHAIDMIWENCVGKKLYVTGGVGAVEAGEAFGANYFLPNLTAYCETCAAIGNVFWNERLFLLHGDAKYIDVLERTLYNGLLDGVSLDGQGFFYPNPLESDGRHARSPWFGVACCPSNITRFLPSLPGYFYAQRGGEIYVNLYAAGAAEIALDGGQTVKLTQETKYPWEGAVKLTVNPSKPGPFAIKLRIPGWARNEAVPGDLYSFLQKNDEPVTVKVNGQSAALALDKGYVSLARDWKSGDTIELNLPLPVRRVTANAQVQADIGRVALQRGPLVYCAEWPDSPDKHVRNLLLANDAKLTAQFEPALLPLQINGEPTIGVETITGQATALSLDKTGQTISQPENFKAIPYYAWAHRGRGEMEVWIANDASAIAKDVLPK